MNSDTLSIKRKIEKGIYSVEYIPSILKLSNYAGVELNKHALLANEFEAFVDHSYSEKKLSENK